MAYTVLARKYRSQTFVEVIGQEAIATTLTNAIATGRIHHGYLFTGTRGVGKTSMARILAKALNCLSYDTPTATPCGNCDACRKTAEGQDVDVLEIDAASNTGVENIRELRSNTAYRPARARFKVYIIDEVHMLSISAFNALLKTLEEPPEHVKFILATTEIQKVPATIQSRCQRFNFRNIGPEPIAARLTEIAAAEGTQVESAVVQRIARLANGSMRDALSILDQLLSVSPSQLDAGVLDELLPPAQNEQVFALFEQVGAGDVAGVLRGLDAILGAGRGIELFCQDAIEVARTLLLLRTCGADTGMVDVPAAARASYVALAQKFELSHYVQMIPMLEELRRHVRFSSAGRALAEVTMLRLARLREWTAIEQLLRQLPAEGDGADQKKKSVADETNESLATCESAPLVTARPRIRELADVAPSEPAPLRPIPAGTGVPASTEAALVRAFAPSAAATTRGGAVGAPTERSRGIEVSNEERRRAEEDPIVRQAIELFDGVVVSVERRPPEGPPALTPSQKK